MANVRRLVELGMVPPLAKEVATQITAAATGGASIVALTNNSGGTPSNTIADVPSSYTEATLANQIASLAAKINEIIDAING